MRTLSEIIDAAKDGSETTHKECLYALLAYSALHAPVAGRAEPTGWQPIETLEDHQREVHLWAPRERIYTREQLEAFPDLCLAGVQMISTRQNWTWGTHWMPLPDPPALPGAREERREQPEHEEETTRVEPSSTT